MLPSQPLIALQLLLLLLLPCFAVAVCSAAMSCISHSCSKRRLLPCRMRPLQDGQRSDSHVDFGPSRSVAADRQ
jgi:hypothetical protein